MPRSPGSTAPWRRHRPGSWRESSGGWTWPRWRRSAGSGDRLTRPRTCADLAAELGVDRDRLRRLLSYAATRGWVRLDRHHRFRPTRVTRFLRRDHPGGWRAWVDFASGAEVTGALGVLDRALASDGDAFASANGAPFFAWMAANPRRHRTFDAAMAAGGRMHGLLLARSLDWSSSRRVCDVGGGDGALLRVLLAEHPHLHGVVLELPEVAARVPDQERLTVVGGDAFRSVPAGCDTYLFVNVLHDWDDRAVVELLRRVAEALSAAPDRNRDPRVIVLDNEARARPRDDLATRADLLMLALTPGGRERTAEEFAALGATADLRLRRSVRLASGDVAHVFDPTAAPGVGPVTTGIS